MGDYLPEEIIAEILAQVPAGKEVYNLNRKLLKIVERAPEGSILHKHFHVNRYGYCPRLDDVLANLRLGGALIAMGHGFNLHRITQSLHNSANYARKNFTDEERKYLEEVASQLEY